MQRLSEQDLPLHIIFDVGRLFWGDLPANATQSFRSDPKKGREHMLGYAMGKCSGAVLNEFAISFFRCLTKRANQSFLSCDQIILEEYAEITFKFWDLVQHLIFRWFAKQKQLTIFHRLNVIFRRLPGKKAELIGYPPAFKCELVYVFLAFIINGIRPK